MLPILHPSIHRSAHPNDQSDEHALPPSIAMLPPSLKRFATVYFNRRTWRAQNRELELLLSSSSTRRSQRRNCGMKRKAMRKKQEWERRCERVQEQELALQGAIHELQNTIATMDGSQLLADSMQLMQRTNRTSVAVEIMKDYFAAFLHGYNVTNPMRAASNAKTREFMYGAMENDVLCREYKGIDNFLNQWEHYTKYHGNILVRLCSITLIDEEEQFISIRGLGEMRLVITEDTFKHLYPAFYEQMQADPRARCLATAILGKEYVISFDKVLHFNRHGKVFAHESKVHLASGLLQLLQDPFATMKLLQAAVMTEDGHWLTPASEGQVREALYTLPKEIL